jgi:uncharacterized protein (TIGR02145 family)
MQKLMKALAALMLTIATLVVAGCVKDPNNINVNENPGYDKPVVETSPVREITGTTVLGGGVVTSDAGGEIIERGVCWDRQGNPTISGTHVVAGTGLGTFTCEITGLTPNTTYHVRAYAINSVGIGYGEDMSFTTVSHTYVDLGLPSGTLWAISNVGAEMPEAYGYYFAWGEAQSKSYYDWSSYQYSNGGTYAEEWDQYIPYLIKYCSNSFYGHNGFTDNLTILEAGDDAATANWGDGWRTPTDNEWVELLAYCTHTWTTRNGIEGRLFTAPNGNSLFLPAAGRRDGGSLEGVGRGGYYWSSTIYSDNRGALSFHFTYTDYYNMYGDFRYYGQSFRTVRSARQN